jgi:uncharacterized membrane protein YhaH (DUF805 family)
VKFGEAVVSGLRNYINFSERASRSEFWFFILFTQIVGIVCRAADYFVFFPIELLGGPALLVGNLALFLPAIAISARRLHDVDRTGWWLPIWFTVIGAIWLIVWWCTKGKVDRNRFGPDPLAAK